MVSIRLFLCVGMITTNSESEADSKTGFPKEIPAAESNEPQMLDCRDASDVESSAFQC